MSDKVCDNCRHYRRMLPGHAGICFFKWRGVRWNEAAPLMPKDGTCDDFSEFISHERSHEQ